MYKNIFDRYYEPNFDKEILIDPEFSLDKFRTFLEYEILEKVTDFNINFSNSNYLKAIEQIKSFIEPFEVHLKKETKGYSSTVFLNFNDICIFEAISFFDNSHQSIEFHYCSNFKNISGRYVNLMPIFMQNMNIEKYPIRRVINRNNLETISNSYFEIEDKIYHVILEHKLDGLNVFQYNDYSHGLNSCISTFKSYDYYFSILKDSKNIVYSILPSKYNVVPEPDYSMQVADYLNSNRIDVLELTKKDFLVIDIIRY